MHQFQVWFSDHPKSKYFNIGKIDQAQFEIIADVQANRLSPAQMVGCESLTTPVLMRTRMH
jgi:hypothetical protein